jgi:hypothetical protein
VNGAAHAPERAAPFVPDGGAPFAPVAPNRAAPVAPVAPFVPVAPNRAAPFVPFVPVAPDRAAPFAPDRAAPVVPFAPVVPDRAAPVVPFAPVVPDRAAPDRAAPFAAGGRSRERRGAELAGFPRQVVLRRAELAAEAAVRAAALADPPAELVARIGPRPAAGPQRAVWEDVVGGLAVYRARHQPGGSGGELGPPPGARPDDRTRDPWLRRRDQAARLVETWAAGVRAAGGRFAGQGPVVPGERAVAGLHALLDAGRTAGDLAAALARRTVDGAGAAVLDGRVAGICQRAGVDPALYDLPAPRGAQQEWTELTRLLILAETTHLAARPAAALAAERRGLVARLAQPADAAETVPDAGAEPRPRAELAARLDRVEAALDRRADDAVLRAGTEPAGYLTALLGPRPTSGVEATVWEQAAGRVERYRHHALGLPYGVPAQPGNADPARQALGERPPQPSAAAEYDQARDAVATLSEDLTL